MTTIDLKHNLHSLIDKVDDNYILEQINEILSHIIENKKLSWDSLSEEKKKSIETGLEQLENGDYIYYEDMKQEFDEWKKTKIF